jgi:hypothetical protein
LGNPTASKGFDFARMQGFWIGASPRYMRALISGLAEIGFAAAVGTSHQVELAIDRALIADGQGGDHTLRLILSRCANDST